jgi:putative transposase
MPRRARIVVPGIAHHITQRGNNRQPVFATDFDRQIFLDLLGDYAPRNGLSVWGYCLMPNHFHVIAIPQEPDALARTFRRLEADYARYFNVRQGACGHLWQARYYSTPMDDRYRWSALAYVERNPVRAGLARHAWAYRWSSAPARLGLGKSPAWLAFREWSRHWTRDEWKRALAKFDDAQFMEEMRDRTMTGFPLGGALTERLEQALGRPLRRGASGRPKKTGDSIPFP